MHLENLKQGSHAHGVLTAGYAYCNMITWMNQLILIDGSQKRCPQFLSVFCDNGSFNPLAVGQLSCHVI